MALPMGRQLFHNRKRKKNRLLLTVLAVVSAMVLAAILVWWGLSRPAEQPGSSSTVESTLPTTVKTLPKTFIDRNTASQYIVLADITAERVLYSKNADAKCYPASLTKLMTALVAVENTPAADTPFTVGNEVYMIDPQSSRAYLTVGTRLTLENLLQAMLLPSGNDAAYVLGVQVGRLIAGDAALDKQAALEVFIGKMNEKAAALGCSGTHFANPDGIHEDNHYTTANDMLKIATAVLGQPTITGVVSQPQVTVKLLSGQSVTWKNSNRLVQENNVFSYDGATGLKTGFTDQAGNCLAASAVREGHTAVAIVMGSPTDSGRFEDASGLMDISFQ